MGRLDVLRSLLHGAARNVEAGLRNAPLLDQLRQNLQTATLRRAQVSDAALTAAMGSLSDVREATVMSRDERLRLQLGFEDGRDLSLTLRPWTIKFAPRGAKEIAFRVQPAEAAVDARTVEVFAALASEIAFALWGPFLKKAAPAGHSAFVHRDGDILSVDLRTVPRVRDALANPMLQSLMDVLKPTRMRVEPTGLCLDLGVEGF